MLLGDVVQDGERTDVSGGNRERMRFSGRGMQIQLCYHSGKGVKNNTIKVSRDVHMTCRAIKETNSLVVVGTVGNEHIARLILLLVLLFLFL